MSNQYSPISHFFVDNQNLADAAVSDYATDAFGPVVNSQGESTQYRTTSKVRALTKTKVFAICNGRILIQPTEGDDTKVNLILKPDISYSPLKIKYFIYRGVDKADLISNTDLQPKNTADQKQPVFLQKLWDQFLKFNSTVSQGGIINTPPSSFPANLIGYDPANQASTTLIDPYFFNTIDTNTTNFFQLPACKEGDHIGNFNGSLGLDIVLDHGDYKLENQEELFKLDLNYAHKSEHVFDTGQIPATPQTAIKRYKEYIHQFMDAAAFWGSHIECGKIRLFDNLTGIKNNDDIFNTVLNKFQTKNKIYVYIQAERGRSYNYYDSSRKVEGFRNGGQLNDNNGWPIIIEETTLTTQPSNNISTVPITLEYNFDSNIPETERFIAVDVISPNNNTAKYPFAQSLLDIPPISSVTTLTTRDPMGRTSVIPIAFQINEMKYCASFLMIYSNLKQEYPLPNYYDNLWPVNVSCNLKLPDSTPVIASMASKVSYKVNAVESSPNLIYWATFDNNRLLNLDPILNAGASIQNKVVFDTGKSLLNTVQSKKRRLFMAAIKRNTNLDSEFNKLNIDTLKAGVVNKPTSLAQYALNIYDDKDFAVYKGKVTDGEDTINALSLIHESDFEKKNSYFHLGITEEEYNLLIYGTTAPSEGQAQVIPTDADNVFFDLKEVLDDNVSVSDTRDFRKFNIGLKYEDNTGNIVSTLDNTNTAPPELYIYTLDGLYFFSKDYSDYQEFYKEFAKAKVEFRTLIYLPSTAEGYDGQFGFDWLRIGDNGDSIYKDIIWGGYERPSKNDQNTEFENPPEAYRALKREYMSIPTQKPNNQYFAPYLNLYSQTYSQSIIADPKPPSKADLNILIEVDEPLSKLDFDFDTTLFSIISPVLSNPQTSSDKTITITCLKDFSENKQIRVLAYPLGVTNKSDAKLAGIIIVGKNDLATRKDLKFVCIRVKTQFSNAIVSNAIGIGEFQDDEKVNLRKSLYQNFINSVIEDYIPVMTNTSDYNIDKAFDLRTDSNFNTKGGYINEKGKLLEDKTSFFEYLKNTFLSRPGNTKYKNYFLIFSFDISTYDKTGGQIQGKNIHNLVLFKFQDRKTTTLSHEVLHGLGLYHTHQEVDKDKALIPVTNPKIKYVYKYATTDNYMSYSDFRTNTWHWQWEIINLNLKK